MNTIDNSSPKMKRSPSPIKAQAEYQQSNKKSIILNESELDSKMQHWEEYKLKGVKMHRRSYHSASFYQSTLYVYGGYEINGGSLGDFMKVNLDLTLPSFEWEEVHPKSQNKPGPRSRHTTIVYKDKLYLYGGQINAVENTRRLFTFDFPTQQWAEIEPKGQEPLPSIDSHVSLLWDKGNDQASMVIVGGFLAGSGGGYSNGVYEYDLVENQSRVLFKNKEVDTTSTTSSPSIPQGRTGLGAAIYKNALYMFGGNEGNTKLNDLWRFDLSDKKWGRVKTSGATIPEARSGHSLICYKDVLILFGGILDVTHEKNDIFLFALTKGTWLAVEKETKWLFEETQRLPSPEKRSIEIDARVPGKRLSLDTESPLRPGKQNSVSPKKFLFKDTTLDTSADLSPSTRAKGQVQTSEMKSPNNNKFTKIKLLDAAPKGGPPSNEPVMTLESETMSPTSKQKSEFKSSMEEKHKRDKQLKKMMLLKEFEVNDDQMKDGLSVVTPVLVAMQKSIKSLGGDKGKEKADSTLASTMVGLDAIRAYAEKAVDDGNPIKVGVKPVARDGHSANVMGEKMFVFGGDRHKMSFNDMFALNLKFFDSISF